MRHAYVLLVLQLVACVGAPAHADRQRVNGSVRDHVRSYRRAHEHELLTSFAELLAIPNVAADPANLRRNADTIVAMLASRGVAGRLLEIDGGPPVVFADLGASTKRAKTLLVYAHYDGQPVDASEWTSAPFTPVARGKDGRELALPAKGKTIDPDARLYARSASDDKAGVFGIIAALEALKATGLAPSVRIKLLFEGEEERSSPHLRAMLVKYAALLEADAVLFIDGPGSPDGAPLVSLGVRGFTSLEMTVYGPNRSLHSGHYGNWAPNPISLLAHLVDTMRDTDGTILVRGIRDAVRPLTASERKLLSATPNLDSELRHELGLAWSEGSGAPLAERVLLPALNLRGIEAGHVDSKAANAIPTEARASIDFRLVPDLTPEKVRALVEDHVRGQGYYVVHDDPDAATRAEHARIVKLTWGDGYPATRTPLETPVVTALLRTLDATGTKVAIKPASGASLPTNMFDEVLKAPLMFLSTVNYDNNQHAANENVRIQNLWDGIELYAVVFVELGKAWR